MYEIEYSPNRVRARFSKPNGGLHEITIRENTLNKTHNPQQNSLKKTSHHTPTKITLPQTPGLEWKQQEKNDYKILRGTLTDDGREVEIIFSNEPEDEIQKTIKQSVDLLKQLNLGFLSIDLSKRGVTFGGQVINGVFKFDTIDSIRPHLERVLQFAHYFKTRYGYHLSIMDRELIIYSGVGQRVKLTLPLDEAQEEPEKTARTMGQLEKLSSSLNCEVELKHNNTLRIETSTLRIIIDLKNKQLIELLVSSSTQSAFEKSLQKALTIINYSRVALPQEVNELILQYTKHAHHYTHDDSP